MGLGRKTHLLDIIAGNQAYGLVLVFCAGFLLGLPPVIFIAFFKYI